MEAKKKANQLVNIYHNIIPLEYKDRNLELSKKAALLAVEEILNNYLGYTGPEYYATNDDEIICDEEYWQKVKTEINNL